MDITQSYVVLFLLLYVEGTIVSYLGGFAASLGIFNLFWVFVLSVVGSVLGDITYYCIGRVCRKTVLKDYLKKAGMNPYKVEKSVKRNTGKAIAVIKFVPGLAAPGFILVGMIHIPFSLFLTYSIILSILYSAILVLLGYYSGITITTLTKYVSVMHIIIPILIIMLVGWLFIRKLAMNFRKSQKI